VTTLCDSLKLIQVFLHDILHSWDGGSTSLFCKLNNFKFIYVLYFLVDILYILSKLSRIFQINFLTFCLLIRSIVKTKITSIRLCFLIDYFDLNHDTFNSRVDFHVKFEFKPLPIYLRCLHRKTWGDKFHSIQISKDPSRIDLEIALSIQKLSTKVRCIVQLCMLNLTTMMGLMCLKFFTIYTCLNGKLGWILRVLCNWIFFYSIMYKDSGLEENSYIHWWILQLVRRNSFSSLKLTYSSLLILIEILNCQCVNNYLGFCILCRIP